MPSAYTDGVCNGKVDTFEKFAMMCARNFGALIEMRDEPLSAPIPDEIKPSDYDEKATEKAKAELDAIKGMSDAQCEDAAAKEYETAMIAHREHVRKVQEVRVRLERMRSRVVHWQPPTSEHEGLKRFMLEQLDETIKWDGTPMDFYLRSAKNISGEDWRKKEEERLRRDIENHEKSHQEEVDRAAGRNLWLSQLRESLKAGSSV